MYYLYELYGFAVLFISNEGQSLRLSNFILFLGIIFCSISKPNLIMMNSFHTLPESDRYFYLWAYMYFKKSAVRGLTPPFLKKF
jgi:hypothetical protein